MAATQYTKADVASRNGKNNGPAWIIYKDGVYDVTKYVNEHPGGADVLIEEAGTDATSAFEDVSHSSDARSVLTKFKIGEIVEEERRFDANGKKKKKVVAVPPSDKPEARSCLNIVTCGLIG